MIKLTAIPYYLSSIPTIIRGFNFWMIPIIFIKKPIALNTSGKFKFFVWNIMDIWTLKEVILDKQYELDKKINKTDIVIDIGGGIGDFSILHSAKAKKIFSFEMNQNRVNLMKKNLEVNGIKNVRLSKEKVKSLDAIFNKIKIKQCDLLKIDCEGCEYDIFKRVSRDTFDHIQRIVMEIHMFDDTMKNQYQILKTKLVKNGFKIIEKENPVHEYLLYFYAYK